MNIIPALAASPSPAREKEAPRVLSQAKEREDPKVPRVLRAPRARVPVHLMKMITIMKMTM